VLTSNFSTGLQSVSLLLNPFSVKRFGILILSLLLSACISAPKPVPLKQGWRNDASEFIERQAWHSQQSSWKLSAKVGIKTPSLRESANLVWQVDGEQNTMRLFGPLGVGSIRVEFNQQQVLLTDSKGKAYRGQSAQQLLSDVTGWPIPIDALRYWLFALPAPDAAYQYQYEKGSAPIEGQLEPLKQNLGAIEQLGWSINYDRFAALSNDSPALPRKIIATRTEEYAGEQQTATVRLIIKSWSPR